MADVEIDLKNTKPADLVGQGIRAYLVRDYNSAVTALSYASECLAKEKGDKHDSLGEVYLYYGKALLEFSREEAEPLGDAVPKNLNENSDDDEDEEENDKQENGQNQSESTEKQTDEKMESTDNTTESTDNQTESTDNTTESTDNPTETSDKKTESTDKKTESTDNKTESTDNKSESTDKQAETKQTNGGPSSSAIDGEELQEEDPSDLQVAWEVLELAKMIFEVRGDGGKARLAETLIVLGEVSMESENFDDAVNDITKGLELYKSIGQTDCRILAETYYKLGVALSTAGKIDNAIENFKISLEILRERLEKLKDQTEERDEIEDIKGLIPEIEEKIVDMNCIKDEKSKELIDAFNSKLASESADSKAKTAEVSDISHLVKRKRKADEDLDESPNNSTKKPNLPIN